jgi:(4-(4-[2-(gamma-L-glutamylamino)ethyl]phenoxymethyl)furan-2-yl)methanamine synthase
VTRIIGWDVGGANVKAALVTSGHDVEPLVLERPFALWREPQHLSAVLEEMAAAFGPVEAMAVTMTAELADCFASKREGVVFVLDALAAAFPHVHPFVYGVDGQFRSVEAAKRETDRVAAANWMASATLVAQTIPDALLVDVGSTTTDIIPVVAGRVAALGRTDTERLRTGELVYTGLLRTPVCAIVRAVPVRERRCRTAAELFAITADVYLWLGRIAERDYTCDTPDGRGRTRAEAGARLARMVCADAEWLGEDGITAIASYVADAQARHIAAAIRQVVQRLGKTAPRLAIVAGHGAAVAETAATEAGFAPRTMEIGGTAARAAPAVAVACLLALSQGKSA